MSSGEIYVPVIAKNTRNGVDGFDPSDPTSGGETGGAFTIRWTSDGGYTGNGWMWEASNNYLPIGWSASSHVISGEYADTETGFIAYMTTPPIPQNLNDILGGWDPLVKYQFVIDWQDKLGVYGGRYGENAGNECIEYSGN